MNPRLIGLAGMIVIFLTSSALLASAAPRVFQCSGADLAAWKEKFQAGDARALKLITEVKREADKSLETGSFSVMNKAFMPPSGDKHDYMSLSPYWWPDPAKSDGKPYIRKDGQINPERAQYDLDAMEQMGDAVGACALAYFFTGDENYAAKAAELMRAWFLSPETRMNPNVKYAQFVPGNDEQRAAGVIETNRIRDCVDADGLLHGSESWTAADSTALKGWFKEFLDYLQNSEQGKKEAAAQNNHGTWYGVQTATYALFIGDDALAKQLIQTHGRDRIAQQVEPDGKQPEELARTNGYDYTRYNILAHIELAMLGERVGLDLWNHKTEDGRSLRNAIDWLLPYAIGEKKWDYQQIKPPKMKETATVLRRAANGMNEPRYEAAIAKLDGVEGPSDMTQLMFPGKHSDAR